MFRIETDLKRGVYFGPQVQQTLWLKLEDGLLSRLPMTLRSLTSNSVDGAVNTHSDEEGLVALTGEMYRAIADGSKLPHEERFVHAKCLPIKPGATDPVAKCAMYYCLPQADPASKRQLAGAFQCNVNPGKAGVRTFDAILHCVSNHALVGELDTQVFVRGSYGQQNRSRSSRDTHAETTLSVSLRIFSPGLGVLVANKFGQDDRLVQIGLKPVKIKKVKNEPNHPQNSLHLEHI